MVKEPEKPNTAASCEKAADYLLPLAQGFGDCPASKDISLCPHLMDIDAPLEQRKDAAAAALQEKSLLLRLLSSAAVAANEATDVKAAMQQVVDEMCLVSGWPVGVVYMKQDENDRLEAADVWHCTDHDRHAELLELCLTTQIEVGDGLVGGVFADGVARAMEFTADGGNIFMLSRQDRGGGSGVRSAMCFPVKVGVQSVAAVVFVSHLPRRLSEHFISVMGDIGTQLGRIIERKRAEDALRYRLQFETLLTDISTRFIALPFAQIDGEIERSLAEVAEFVGADCGYVIKMSDASHMLLTHLWSMPNSRLDAQCLNRMDSGLWPDGGGGAAATVYSIDEMASDSGRKWMRQCGVCCMVNVPMFYQGRLTGFFGFACRICRRWRPEELSLLRLVGQVYTNALTRKESEEALRKSRAGQTLAQRIAHLGNWDLDLRTGQLHWSDEVFRIFGFEPNSFTPSFERYIERIPREDRVALNDGMTRALAEKAAYNIEHRIVLPDGTERFAVQRAELLFDHEGSPVQLAGSIQDISQQKNAQKEREMLLRTLAAKNEELESIIYASSHDLRSPLVNIRGFSGELACDCARIAELLQGVKLPGKVRQELELLLEGDIPACINYINVGGRKMDDLIRGLLRLSRLGRDALQVTSLDMNRLVAGVVAGLNFVIDGCDAEMRVSDLPPCRGDSAQISQVFSSLIDNAAKYLDGERKGVISISGSRQDGRTIYRVEDNGVGISPAHKDRIFEIFHRLNPEHHVPGDGLGLTIARRIVQRHNGDITVESEEGKGSTFIITLPD